VSPLEAGMLVGRGTDALYGVVQIHYDNPKGQPGIVDTSVSFFSFFFFFQMIISRET
jgi:hypothetical protein